MSLPQILQVLDRARTGPLVPRRGWEAGVVNPIINDKLAAYGLKDIFDRSNLVNQDDGLAGDFFRAGFEVALEAGRVCLDTERIIRVKEDELKAAIRKSPSKITVGQSADRRVIESRRPEDKKAPKFCAPLAITASESVWVRLMRGIAEVKEVDILQGARLKTVMGRSIESGTPYEIVAGKINASLQREALRQAKREGLASTAVISSTTFLGHAGGYGVPNGFDPKKDLALILSPTPLKTSYDSLNKVVHTICCGGKVFAGSSQTFGRRSETVEGVALLAVASALLEIAVHQSSIASSGLIDVRYNGSCGGEAVWATSVAFQAISRNTRLITNSTSNQVAGPCTKQLLYESAVAMTNLSVSGLSMTVAPRSAGGKFADYLTPLEVQFCGKVLKGTAGMKRGDANEIAKKLIPKYEGSLTQAPRGKSFPECYDLRKMRPSTEWRRIYEETNREVADLGLRLDD